MRPFPWFRRLGPAVIGLLAGLLWPGGWGPQTALAEAALTVEPTRLHLQSRPGEAASAPIRVANESSQRQRVYFHFTDWEPAGGGSRLDPGAHPRSLAPYLSPSLPWSWVLEPGEVRTLLLRVQRPDGDEGTRWSALNITAEPDPLLQGLGAASGSSPGPVVTPRLRRQQVVRIHHTPLPLPEGSGYVSDLQPLDPHGRWLSVSFTNTSRRVLEVSGQWRVSDPGGVQLFRQSLPSFLSYPERTRTVRIGPLPQLPPGTYHLLVLLFPEDGSPSASQIPFRVEPVEGGAPGIGP